MIRGSHQKRTLSLAIISLALLAFAWGGSVSPAQAQIYTPLYDFGAIDSSQTGPNGQLALGQDGNYYGTLNPNAAQIFEVTPVGTESLLWAAGDLSGTVCYSGLTLGPDGLLYGTCAFWQFNSASSGVIFRYDPAQGQNGFSVIYTFPQFQGQFSSNPSALTLGTDGNLYGTTSPGQGPTLYGTFFRVSTSGTFKTLYTFQGQAANDGAYPSVLTLGTDGNFYGTTNQGGTLGTNNGAAFKITPKGKEKILYSFDFTNGRYPLAGLSQGTDGKFYGTASRGGINDQGTIVQLTTAGKVTLLHSFDFSVDLAKDPQIPLTVGTDGSLYGPSTACYGGGCGQDSLFKITTKGVYTDLYSGFSNPCTDSSATGCYLSSPMALNPDGTFYGTTSQGGDNGQRIGRGVFYNFNSGLVPFVQPQYPLGKIGTTIGIFGHGFNSASSVAFNGKPASFTVVSDTYLTATIPVGATKGYVSVSEAAGSLKSIFKFTPKK